MLKIPVSLALATLVQQLIWVAGKPLQEHFGLSQVAAELVNIRIEGAEKTIFEGLVPTFGHNITTPSGGNHHCDGTNNNSHPKPGPTGTTALYDAGKIHGFGFDGTFFTQFDDYLITSIREDYQTTARFWGLLVNYNFTNGGCQTQVSGKDEVLWAFDAFSKVNFLKLEALPILKAGESAVLKIVNGTNAVPIQGATLKRIDGSFGTIVGTSNAGGIVSLQLPTPGIYSFKASKDDSIRSNRVTIIVE